ncbi:MAG: IS6 family transposase [Candidatus Bathyarchaeia archaeon]|jgi:transposase-like protein
MSNQLTTTRKERGQQIAQLNGQIKRVDDCIYTVKSQSHDGEYCITKVDGEWLCECPDNKYRHVTCKHIHAVIFSRSLRAEVAVSRVIPELNVQNCQYCGSNDIVKNAVRHNKQGDIQRYLCRACGKRFSINIGFEKMRATPQVITSAMQLYFTGESYRNVQKFLKMQGVEVDHSTIIRWVRKYIRLMESYVEKMKPNVSDTWRADEIYMKVKGNMKYLFAMMDDETRFWIAQEMAETKEKHDARTLFVRAKYLMGKQPKTLITDGLPSYAKACQWAFDGTQHIRKITLKGKAHNNNKMERMNGEIRDREKTMRGLKRKRTPILSGYQIYHNYIRPHESLSGKTPAEACGIKVEGQNKWKTLIENATITRDAPHQTN